MYCLYCFYNVTCLTFFSAGKELRDFFATCKEGHIRVVKVGLENIDRNYLFGSFEITSIRLYTLLRNSLRGVTRCVQPD
jgi:hypothetical protein